MIISKNNIIESNIIENNDAHNIMISYGINNHIRNNILRFGGGHGLKFENSNKNLAQNNVVVYNNEAGITIGYKSNNNSIIKNNVSYNNNEGIWLYLNSTQNHVFKNIIDSNGRSGIWLWEGCDSNEFMGNNISYNMYGLAIYQWTDLTSKNNLIYANNFFYNGFYPHLNGFDDGFSNYWNNSEYGNYWEDYYGLDSDGDGIGDIPYILYGSAGSRDFLPLMNPYFENDPPTITIVYPAENQALQDIITFKIEVIDTEGIEWVKVSIRERGGENGVMISDEFEEINAVYTGENLWILEFNTTRLPDGYYTILLKASDILGLTATKTINVSIRNWVTLELLPSTPNSKAGRTIPIKFSIRVSDNVDPNEPFVLNEELTVKIYEKQDETNQLLQISIFGVTSKDYRINILNEFYITNFKTLINPKNYLVEIWRKEFLIGSFEFSTYS